ncbi:MAG TPA: hypothetical protein VIP82_10300 [Microbacterium sp.]|uniref:hypothetical protein n=1 Tax=Microbacterium sp. TaxID=51671 RepID=UPI002F93D659
MVTVPAGVAGPGRLADAAVAAAASSPSVGTRFVVTEAYRDAAAFAEHLAAPHGTVFNAALGPLIVERGSVLTFLTSLG